MQKKELLKRIFSLGLAAALLLPTAAQAAYSDTSGHWAEGAIDKWSGSYGILSGYEDGTFRPDNTITRGAFAGIMSRFLQYQAEADRKTFSDIQGEYWESAILKLNAAGVYLGTDGKALVNHDITRQQAVTMIARAFGIPETAGTLPYADAGSIAEYAKGYLMTMQQRGYITDVGSDQMFRPTAAITRAEVVNILNNMIAVLVQNQNEFSENVHGNLMVNGTNGANLKGMDISGDLIIAPGVSGTVTLTDVTVQGQIQNLGKAAVERTTTPVPVPEEPSHNTEPEEPSVPEEPKDYFMYNGQKISIDPELEKNELTASDFYWDENGRLVYSGGKFDTRFGIDVAAYQNRNTTGDIDWDAVRQDGVDFAMVRVALRGTSTGVLYPDAFYAANIDGAMAAGIDTGVYIFSQAISVEEAVEEADYVISLLDGHKISGPVAFDWEMKDSTYRVYGTDPAVATAAAKAFCQRIEEAGYDAMVYVSKYVGYVKFDLSQLSDYQLWYPEYKYTTTSAEKVYPSFYYQMDYWQYSDKTSINGLGGRVDTNIQFLR